MLHRLGEAYGAIGDAQAAIDALEEAVQRGREDAESNAQDERLLAIYLQTRAIFLSHSQRSLEAEASAIEAVDIWRRITPFDDSFNDCLAGALETLASSPGTLDQIASGPLSRAAPLYRSPRSNRRQPL